jgi:hypothetical protein
LNQSKILRKILKRILSQSKILNLSLSQSKIL